MRVTRALRAARGLPASAAEPARISEALTGTAPKIARATSERPAPTSPASPTISPARISSETPWTPGAVRPRTLNATGAFAVGACFTVLVFAFAYVFLAIQEIWPSSFTAFQGPGQRSFLELIYLSAAQLTSVGLSDVVPITPHARSVVMIQQLAGLGYVALFVSRLVGLTINRQQQQHDAAGSARPEAGGPGEG